MGLPLIGLPQASNTDLTTNQPGIIPDTDKWWGVTSSTWWDGLTSFSVMISYDSYLKGAQDDFGLFSAQYKDGSNNIEGILVWQYMDVCYVLFGDGDSVMSTESTLAFNGYRYATAFNRSKGTSPRVHVCFSWNSAGSGSSTFAIYNQGKVVGGTLQSTRVSTVKTSGRTSALGDIGTNTEIRVGNRFDGTSTNSMMRDWFKIRGCKFWKNEALSLANFDSIVGYTSGVDNIQVRDVKEIEKLGYGGSTGISLPERDWRIEQVSAASPALGFRDKGTESSKEHMTTGNGAAISVYKRY